MAGTAEVLNHSPQTPTTNLNLAVLPTWVSGGATQPYVQPTMKIPEDGQAKAQAPLRCSDTEARISRPQEPREPFFLVQQDTNSSHPPQETFAVLKGTFHLIGEVLRVWGKWFKWDLGGKLCGGQRAWVVGLYLSGPLQYKDLAKHMDESGN